MEPMNLPEIPQTLAALAVSGARHGDFPAIRHRGADGFGGDWQDLSFREIDERIQQAGAGLVTLGVKPGDRVAILADSQANWTVADLAALATGAIVVPIYPTSTTAEVEWVLRDSGAGLVFVGDAAAAATLASLNLEVTVIGLHEGLAARSLADVEASGDDGARAELLARAAAVIPEDVASIVYTSGTTGSPKGCTLTHANLRGVYSGLLDYGLIHPGDVSAVFLPQAHLFARFVELCSYACGGTVAFVSKEPRQLLADLAETKPMYLPAVPRIFEKVYSVIHADPSRSHEERLAMGKALLGGRIRQATSGAAPIDLKILEFFHEAGVPVIEGYGLTEGTGVMANSANWAFRLGTVGRALNGTEIRISDEGEILLGGVGVFAGYWNNAEATAEVLRDGWLLTGDLGSLDEEGYLSITGRIKDIIVTAGGKNIAPAPVEQELSRHPLVSQVVMIGDRRPFCSALFTLQPETVGHYADPEAELTQVVEAVNQTLPGHARIRQWRILPEELSAVAGTLTATQKIRRAKVVDSYEDLIGEIYREAALAGTR